MSYKTKFFDGNFKDQPKKSGFGFLLKSIHPLFELIFPPDNHQDYREGLGLFIGAIVDHSFLFDF